MSAKNEVLLALKIANAARVKSDVDGVAKSVDKMGDQAQQTGKQTKAMGAESKKAGDETGRMSKKMKSAIAGGLSLAGAVGILKTSLTSARNEAGAFAQVENTFGEGETSGFEAWATNAAKSMGMARDVVYKQSAEIGRILGGFEIPQKQNAQYTKALVQRSADLARFTRQDQGGIQKAFAAAMQGRTRGLAKYGIQVNKTTLTQQAMDQGLIKSTKEALTPQAKAMATYSLIMKQTAKQGGAFAKDSDSWAVKQKIVQAQFENMKATLGKSLMPVFSAFMGLMQDGIGILNKWGNALSAKARPAIKAVSDWLLKNEEQVQSWMQSGQKAFGIVMDAVDKLRTTVVGIAKWMFKMYGEFKAGNTVVVLAASVLGTLGAILVANAIRMKIMATATAAWTAITKAARAAQVAWNASLLANPLTWIAVAVIALGVAIWQLWKRNETFRNGVKAVWAAIKGAVGSAVAWVKARFLDFGKAITAVRNWVSTAVANIRAKWADFKQAGANAVNGVKERFSSFISYIKGMPGRFAANVSGMFNGLKNAFRDAINWIIGKWNGFELSLGPISVPGLPDIPKLSIGTPDIPMLATGGVVDQGGWALVGERGPELAKLPGGSTVYDAEQTASAMSTGPSSARLALKGAEGPMTNDLRAIAQFVQRCFDVEVAHA